MAKTVKKSGPKKAKRNVPNGVAHIQSTFNNTIVSITDTAGEVISWSSAVPVASKVLAKAPPSRLKPLQKQQHVAPLTKACVRSKCW